MNIRRAKQEITDCIEAYLKKDDNGEYIIPPIRQRPVLLMGPPGIGKTQIMEQIARETGIALVAYTITHHTRQSAVGLPFIREKVYGGQPCSVTEYTMSEIIASVYEKMEQTGLKEGILFIDEINCVSETLAPAMLQFLQCKTFGNQKVPEGWIIVAAGNPPEYNKSVREFDVVTLDRLKKIDVEENYEVWKEYAYESGIHPAVMSYLDIRREYFYRIESTVDGKMFATARGWEDLSQLLTVYEMLGKKVDREVIHQYIQHWKIAKDFAVYLQLYEKYKKDYGLEKIFQGVYSKDMLEKLRYASFDERFSVVGMIIGKLNGIFKECFLSDRFVTMLYGHVKNYKESGNLGKVCDVAKKEYEHLRKAQQLTKEQDSIYRKVTEQMEQYQFLTAREHMGKDREFQTVKEAFQKEVTERERVFSGASKALDHAFDFMEDAFGDSQEMVVFVTELNTSFYSVQYLKENGCDKYHRYNKMLLIDEQREFILKQMDEAETNYGMV